jgi:hypothetical protein
MEMVECAVPSMAAVVTVTIAEAGASRNATRRRVCAYVHH